MKLFQLKKNKILLIKQKCSINYFYHYSSNAILSHIPVLINTFLTNNNYSKLIINKPNITVAKNAYHNFENSFINVESQETQTESFDVGYKV